MIDMHVHTKYCPHAKGEVAQYVAVAKKKGLKIIGFSEHFPLPNGFEDPAPVGDESAMLPSSLEHYMGDVLAAKSEDVNTLLGMEIDWIPGYESAIRNSLSQVRDKLDYVVGSIHFLAGNWGFDYDEEEFKRGLREHFGGKIDDCINSYFDALQQMINADIVDVVAHLDLIKKFNKGEKYFSEDNPTYSRRVEETLQLVKKKGLLLEINTAGIDKTVEEMYPSRAILERCHELGIRLTLGSDAHKPEQVGRYFDKTIDMIKGIGYTELCYVQNGKVREISI